MKTISILEAEMALSLIFIEIQTSEGIQAYELIRKYMEQQRDKQIKEGTLITKQ